MELKYFPISSPCYLLIKIISYAIVVGIESTKMIIYTNKGNPFALKLLISSKLARREVIVEQVDISGKYTCTILLLQKSLWSWELRVDRFQVFFLSFCEESGKMLSTFRRITFLMAIFTPPMFHRSRKC